jgi:hypothetical protein
MNWSNINWSNMNMRAAPGLFVLTLGPDLPRTGQKLGGPLPPSSVDGRCDAVQIGRPNDVAGPD